MDILIYGTNTCSYCTKAKQFLKERLVEYTYEDIYAKRDSLQKVKDAWAAKGQEATVPAIWVGGNFIGGYDDLRNYLI
jgi:glutaredoxin